MHGEQTPLRLSPREAAVLALYDQGLLRKQIGGRLGMSESAVKKHVHRILVKSFAVSMRHAAWLRRRGHRPP